MADDYRDKVTVSDPIEIDSSKEEVILSPMNVVVGKMCPKCEKRGMYTRYDYGKNDIFDVCCNQDCSYRKRIR